MRHGKTTLLITVSLFSSIILGNMTIQQAKADATNQTPASATSSISNQQTGTATNSEAAIQPVTQNSTPNQQQTPVTDNETQTVHIGFKDQFNNPIQDSNKQEYSITKDSPAGSTISPSDINDQFNSDLNGGYTINSDQAPITVEQGNNNYTFNVTAKTYSMTIYNYDSANNTPVEKGNVDLTVGQSTLVPHDESFNGYGFIGFQIGDNPIPDSANGNVTLTYDILSNVPGSSENNQLKAIYSTNLEQSIPIQRLDTEGNLISGDNSDKIDGYKTNDDITGIDLSSYISKSIPGYTYLKTLPFEDRVNPNTVIKLIYTNNSLNYLKVNYQDKNTNDIIYTDYLPGEIGDNVIIKNIDNIVDFPDGKKYQFTNPNQAVNYQIKSDNDELTIAIEKLPLTVNLVQSLGDLQSNQSFKIAYGDTLNSAINYLSNQTSDVEELTYDMSDGLKTFDPTTFDNTDKILPAMINGAVGDSNSGLTYLINIKYKTSILSDIKQININYQTGNNSIVSQKTFQTTPADVSAIDKLIQDNAPTGYTLTNDNSISSLENSTIEINAPVTKDAVSGNNNGSSIPDTDHNNETPTNIQEKISVFPDLSEITVYDDSGNATDKTISANSDWYTDQKKVLNGETFYRIAPNQWINENSVYNYDAKTVFIQTYADSPKKLVSSRNQLSTNRELAPNSAWYSDRNINLNGQKNYRVATDEWANTDDVFEYQPINQIVQPTRNAQLFNDRGSVVGLAPTYALVTDRLALINGIQMYRVATNEWLPVSSVE